MLSPAGSHNFAKTLALQENKKALKAKEVDYGENCAELLATYDRDTRLWKTSQLSLVEIEGDGLALFSETWPRSGMTANGIAYRLPNLARTITEIGSGLLPTPTRTDHKSEKMSVSLVKKRQAESSRGIRITEYMHRAMLPTPDAGSSHRGGYISEYGGSSNPFRGTEVSSALLNPCWVEELMGYPTDWTDLELSETA